MISLLKCWITTKSFVQQFLCSKNIFSIPKTKYRSSKSCGIIIVYFIVFLDIIQVMNPHVPEYILTQLRSAGYDVHTELGDTVITQGSGPHAIYVQVRDGKKTYIPITIVPEQPEPEKEPVPTDDDISEIPDVLFESSTLSQPVIAPLEDVPANTFIPTTTTPSAQQETMWDENMTELLAKIQSTKETLRTLIQS
jgi:hypothetical protein